MYLQTDVTWWRSGLRELEAQESTTEKATDPEPRQSDVSSRNRIYKVRFPTV